jgi:hypothetical protein
MSGVLLVLAFIATFIYAVARSARKLRTALIGFAVMMGIELIAIATMSLISLHAGNWRRSLALSFGFGGVLAIPISSLAGTVAALIASGKDGKVLTTEVSR